MVQGLSVWRLKLGIELRKLRDAAGLTLEVAGRHMEWSMAKMSRLENGRVNLRLLDLDHLLQVYGVSDDSRRHRLLALGKQARAANQMYVGDVFEDFSVFLAMEAWAHSLRMYEPTYITGLLQTEDYMRAIFEAHRPKLSGDEIAHQVQLRRYRQGLLTKEDTPRIWVILDEGVLHRTVGGPEVMREQITYLIDVVSLIPMVTIQVMPFGAGAYPGWNGPFAVVGLSDGSEGDVAYTEGPAGGIYLEQPTDIRRCTLLFDHMRGIALSDTDSEQLMRDVVKAL